MFEISFPRVEPGFDFGGFPALIIVVLGVPHLMPEVPECWARLIDSTVDSYSNTFNISISDNGFTPATIL